MFPFIESLKGYRARVALSLLMALAEAMGEVALPFLIGMALEDYLDGTFRGLILLGAVGLVTMALATSRRLHDARLYSRIYETTVDDALEPDAGLSENTARLNMLREVIDFLEHDMPTLIASVIAFIGTLIFLAALSVPVFLGAVVVSIVVAAIYAATTGRTMALNRGYNDEYERQVDVLRHNDTTRIRRHVGLLNSWTIKLSDLDAVNTAVLLILTVALQILAIVTVTRRGLDEGTILSVVLYVFEFSAIASFLPDSWQEYLRLREILERLDDPD